MQIKVVGIGGIGGSLLPTLSRYLSFGSSGVEITLIDGGRYVEKNRDRQVFDRVGNKAEVTATRLARDSPQVYFRSQSEYLTDSNIVSLIREGDIVFLCVDNHATRKLVSDHCEDLSNVVVISGGNDYTDGSVQIFIRRDAENITLPLANHYHPEIEKPQDENPGDVGCDELAESEPQLLITNNAVAACMLNVFYAYLQGEVNFDEVYLDIVTGNTRSVSRREAPALT